MPRRSLVWHIFLPFLAVVVLSLVLATGYTSRSLRDFFYDQTSHDLESQARLLIIDIPPLDVDENDGNIQDFCRERLVAAGTRITVITPDGRVIGETHDQPETMENHATRPEILAAKRGEVGASIRYSASLAERRMYVALPIVQSGEVVGVMRTSRTLASIDRALEAVQKRIAFVGLLLALAAAVFSFLIARRINIPLREMKEGAERLAAGRLDTRLAAGSNSVEIGALTDAFNGMAQQLQSRIRTIETQRNEQNAVLSSMVECVLAIDCDELVIRINQASADLLGIDPAAATGRTLHEVVRNPELIALGKAALSGTEPVEQDVVLHREGERYLQVHATGLQGPDGQRLGALLVFNDVTHIRRLENLRKDFVANVSHELRTPITSIKGFIETLMNDPQAEPATRARFLAIVDRQADRLQAIIDDLLSLSRLERSDDQDTLARTDVLLEGLLREAVDVATARVGSDLPPIHITCDRGLTATVNGALLEQALINLVDNAINHGGPNNEIHVAADTDSDRVMISVRDEGPGIPAEHLPRLFERFYRVDRARSRDLGGTGLGLAIVKHIAQAHGGSATVTSTPGKGSTFTICFPKNVGSSVDECP